MKHGKDGQESNVGTSAYHSNLKELIVGNTSPIQVPAPTKASGNTSNSVVDSGTNGLMLDQDVFDAVAKKLTSAADATLTDALRAGYVPMSALGQLLLH